MLVVLFKRDDRIIYICLYVSPEHWGEDLIHHPLIGINVFKTKGHDLVTVASKLDHKGCLTLVLRVHTNLVVSRERIQ